jgi:Polyphosphate kinase 2 (PPK2)
MNKSDPVSRDPLQDRIHREMMDNVDEEIEMELDDSRLGRLRTEIGEPAEGEPLDRHFYFKELLRLQGELVKLQDWVQTNKLKVVVIFEGRDAAGKGGVIKRITQRLNPRVCRVVALPAPNDRERTQWYFQRYVPHLPAGGEIVSCSTAAGTTVPASNSSWASALRMSRGILSLRAGVRDARPVGAVACPSCHCLRAAVLLLATALAL